MRPKSLGRLLHAATLALSISFVTASAHAAPHAPLSPKAASMLRWVAETRDHAHRPFMILDKQQARVWVFGAAQQVLGSSPVLLGRAVGDDSVPGIGERPMSLIREEERTTPAGRFAVEVGRNAKGEDIFWIDYDAAVSMHRVRPVVAAERRLERLATRTPADNRISYGCINVPVPFYERVIAPVFGGQPGTAKGMLYVMPETRPLQSMFGGADASGTRSAKAQ